MTSTRDNPRIGQSRSSLTSLGAVGGARGTAAGALRILIEFLTEYDPAAIKQLESDLAQLTATEEQLGNQQIKIADKVAKTRTKIAEAEALVRAKFRDREAKSQLRESEALRQTGRPTDQRQAAQLLSSAIKKAGLSAAEEKTVRNLVGLRTRLRNLEAQELRIAQDRLAVSEQQQAVSGELGGIRGIAQGLPSRLGGLAIGAIGGIFGGAVLGLGFAAAEAALEKVGEAIQNLVDPARQARDAIREVGAEINKMAEAEGISREGAAARLLGSLGVGADQKTVQLLAEAAAQQALNEALQAELQIDLIKQHGDALDAENIKTKVALLISEAKARGDVVTVTGRFAQLEGGMIDTEYYEALAIKELSAQLDNAAASSAALTAQQQALQRNLEATALLAKFAAEALSSTISAGADAALINPLDRQIEALQGSEPSSKRTQALEAQIEKLQSGGGGGGDASKRRELANLAEERALILLRQRLRLLGTSIDLEKFEGKFLLEAINAKIKALQKQSDAQERLNHALDLQFRMSQVLRRQEGESIRDFLERRAQNNRELLAEQAQMEQDRIIEGLREQQEKVQDEVALAELSERQKTAAATSGADNRIKELQKELAASKKADADALRAKIETLQKQREAQRAAAENAIRYSSITANEEIRQAARAANSIERIAALSGQSRGLTAAKAFLQALLDSGVLRGAEVTQIQAAINRINATLSAVGEAQYNVMKNTLQGKGPPVPFASGGYIPLNAGSTPFGQNARFGEQGTEAGMLVLSNQMMKKMGKGGQPFGDINVYGADDPMRSAFLFKQRVKEIVREELR